MDFRVVDNEELDAFVARHVLKWPDAALDSHKVFIPPFSSSWKHAGAVLGALRDHALFNELLVEQIDNMFCISPELDWKTQPTLVFAALNPCQICRIAVKAIDPQGDLLKIA